MDGKERVRRTFAGERPDRIPIGEDFWGETLDRWRAEGHLRADESPVDHFDFDLDRAGLPQFVVLLDFWETLEETPDWILATDGNRATLRSYRHHAGGIEHIAFHVKDRATWESFAKPRLTTLDPRRIPFEGYARARRAARAAGRHFSSDAFGPFEMMQRLCGHEALLLAMAVDPDWVRDMVATYVEFDILHFEELFRREGLPDSTWVADDLGFKLRPFMSPAMLRDLLLPGYVRLFDYLHGKGLKVILHSCGFVEPLLPELIEAGVDCLEALEVKAGMDLARIHRSHGDRLVLFGNIDIRALEANDREWLEKELQEKILPVVRAGGRCMLHSDHSISPRVDYETYAWFVERARELTA
jgi:uroporphyrinogen decarboxylase